MKIKPNQTTPARMLRDLIEQIESRPGTYKHSIKTELLGHLDMWAAEPNTFESPDDLIGNFIDETHDGAFGTDEIDAPFNDYQVELFFQEYPHLSYEAWNKPKIIKQHKFELNPHFSSNQ